MKKKIFNLAKLATSRMLYLFLGIGLTFVVSIAYGSHNNWWTDWNATHNIIPINGMALNHSMWNGLLGKVNKLDMSDDPCISGFTRYGNTCWSNDFPGKEILGYGNTGLPAINGAGIWDTWQVATIGDLAGVATHTAVLVGFCNQSLLEFGGVTNSGVLTVDLNNAGIQTVGTTHRGWGGCDADQDNFSGFGNQEFIVLNNSKQFAFIMNPGTCGGCGAQHVGVYLRGYIED